MARKPFSGTVASNVVEHGTGALNIDGCRVPTDEDRRRNAKGGENGLNGESTFKIRDRRAEDQPMTEGRWPANVVLEESTAEIVDSQSGYSKDGVAVNRNRIGDGSNYDASSYRINQTLSGGSGVWRGGWSLSILLRRQGPEG